jgi:hypothetical protein
VAPLDGCARADYCFSQENALNTCIIFPAGRHECVCDARGYVASADLQLCIAPIDPCNSGRDLCSSVLEPLNTCRSVADGTGSYQCACFGRGWGTGQSSMSCIPPIPPENRCETSDPCSTNENIENVCTDIGNGEYQCSCDSRWREPYSKDRCISPESICYAKEVRRTRSLLLKTQDAHSYKHACTRIHTHTHINTYRCALPTKSPPTSALTSRVVVTNASVRGAGW